MGRKKNKRKQSGVLAGHKKVGTKFLPPMMQLPNMKSTSYVNQLLPELIWVGLINDNVGYIRGARLLENVFLSVKAVLNNNVTGNFAFSTSYKQLSDAQQLELVRRLSMLGIIDELREYLSPLTLLYDHFPMRFLGPPDELIEHKVLLSNISSCVDKHMNKYETPGIVLNGTPLLSRLVTETISFPSNMDLPDFNAVVNSPESEEAKRAAGFMRANALAEFPALELADNWPRYFWNRGFELSPCEPLGEIDEDE